MRREPALRRHVRKNLLAMSAWKYTFLRPLNLARKLKHFIGSRKPGNWDHRTFSRKVAWRCRHPDPWVDYALWVDKHRVKHLVGGMLDVPETYLVLHDPADIDSRRLPDTFVMKATHGWDMSILVENGIVKGGNRTTEGAGQRSTSDYLQQVARGWLSSEPEKQRQCQEQHYRYVRPGILFEEVLSPVDYELQLFLFDGRCRFAMVVYRGFHHARVSHRLYDETWLRLGPGTEESASSYEQAADDIMPPSRELLENLLKLCQSIDHVRADFLVSGGKYYFSEFTFTHNGPGGPGLLGKYDAHLGRFWSR